MDRKELREDYIELGRKTLKGLDESGIKATSALWFLLPDSGWRFVIATPSFDENDPSKAYRLLQGKIIDILGDGNSLINSISIIGPQHPLVQLLKVGINTGSDSISGIRFTGNVINGQFIEDAYIYRVS